MIPLKLYNKVLAKLGGDKAKATAWVNTPNPLLGDLKPSDLIYLGKKDKLEKFIENSHELI